MKSQVNGGDPSAILANRLELVERAADDLAHEIKNPLHSMVINLEVLRRRIGRLDEPAQAEVIRYVDVLGGELDRLSHRIELLLRLLRPHRGDDSVPINEAVEELWELIQLEAARHSVAVRFVPLSGFDRGRVPREPTRQVLFNLVLHLLELLSPGGRLELRAELNGEEVQVVLAASSESENSPPPVADESADLPARIGVARLLSQSIGGRVETARASGRSALVFSVPLSA